jgi:hypothetical protein
VQLAEFEKCCDTGPNGKEATINRALDGSTYRWFKTQQLILGRGTAIWWVTEPPSIPSLYCHVKCEVNFFVEKTKFLCLGSIHREISLSSLFLCCFFPL